MIRKSSLYSLIFTIFNDALGWGVVLTVFAPLLLDPNSHFLNPDISLQSRNIFLGLLIGCYPLTQFFFMPVVGALSDHLGRKKILEWTIFSAGISFVLSAISIWYESLLLLFISRILSGVFSANAATAQAAIADISSEREKTKNLSLSGIAGGLSWVVGPPLGGFLSSKKYVPWADFATPFWIVAILFLINYIWVAKAFKETYVKTHREKHDWKQEIKNLFRLSKIRHMPIWLIVTFFFYTGWGFYILFYPTLLVQRFQFDQSEIGLLSGYLSLFWLATSIALNRGIGEQFKTESIILFCMPVVGVCIIGVAFFTSISWWYALFPLCAICGSSIFINLLALLSNLAGKENQGKVFGVSQSLQSLSMFISPLIAGVLATVSERAPLTLGGLILIGTGILATWSHSRGKRRLG